MHHNNQLILELENQQNLEDDQFINYYIIINNPILNQN